MEIVHFAGLRIDLAFYPLDDCLRVEDFPASWKFEEASHS